MFVRQKNYSLSQLLQSNLPPPLFFLSFFLSFFNIVMFVFPLSSLNSLQHIVFETLFWEATRTGTKLQCESLQQKYYVVNLGYRNISWAGTIGTYHSPVSESVQTWAAWMTGKSVQWISSWNTQRIRTEAEQREQLEKLSRSCRAGTKFWTTCPEQLDNLSWSWRTGTTG